MPTLGHILRELGYHTAYKGKWHLSHIAEASDLTYGEVKTTTNALLPFGFADYNLNGNPHGSHMSGFIFDKVTPWTLIRESLRQGRLGPSRDNRALFRGIHGGRYQFARYFAPSNHHTPTDIETLIAHNDLELYDLQIDPDELINLANKPEEQRKLIEGLNARLNELVALEVGVDDGREHPGPAFLYS